jgi:DNA-binding helix-turn-helix protein
LNQKGVNAMYAEMFPQKIAKARIESGYTQREVEKLTKISHSKISKYETGHLEPNLETLGILADFYCVSVDWLLGTKGYNWNPNKPKE